MNKASRIAGIFLLLFLLTFSAAAQTRVRGQVLSGGKPLVYFQIEARQANQTIAATETDSEGRFELSVAKPGNYEIVHPLHPGAVPPGVSCFCEQDMDRQDLTIVERGDVQLGVITALQVCTEYSNDASAENPLLQPGAPKESALFLEGPAGRIVYSAGELQARKRVTIRTPGGRVKAIPLNPLLGRVLPSGWAFQRASECSSMSVLSADSPRVTVFSCADMDEAWRGQSLFLVDNRKSGMFSLLLPDGRRVERVTGLWVSFELTAGR